MNLDTITWESGMKKFKYTDIRCILYSTIASKLLHFLCLLLNKFKRSSLVVAMRMVWKDLGLHLIQSSADSRVEAKLLQAASSVCWLGRGFQWKNHLKQGYISLLS